MTNKINRWCGKRWCSKSIAFIFTSIVAPLVVNMAVRNTPDGKNNPVVPAFTSPAAAQPAQTVRIIASGSGRTPEAAFQDVVHTALRQALASLVDAETWSKNDATLCADVLHDLEGLLLGWRDLSVRKAWGIRGLFYHEQAAVEVNLSALAHRLRDCHTACWNDPIPAISMQGASLSR